MVERWPGSCRHGRAYTQSAAATPTVIAAQQQRAANGSAAGGSATVAAVRFHGYLRRLVRSGERRRKSGGDQDADRGPKGGGQ